MNAHPPHSQAILEQAILDVRQGQAKAFEAAFQQAQSIIASMPGYLGHEVRRCAENDHRYLLLVWWDSIESHTEGFRNAPEYQRWRELLHHFYDPFPTVEHYVARPSLRGEVTKLSPNALDESLE